MSVDFEAIAQRGRCDVSSLRLALPLLEQGYTPPFLARYRRDELGGLDESTLWALSAALQSDQAIAARREELTETWQQTPLADPAIGHAIKKANSQRMLARLARRLKSESRETAGDSARLAVRLLSPQQGDGSDPAEIAGKIDEISDASTAVGELEDALAKRLAGDPRLIGAAVRWLAKHAKIHIAAISDPHGQEGADAESDLDDDPAADNTSPTGPASATEQPAQGVTAAASETTSESEATTGSEPTTPDTASVDTSNAEVPASGIDEPTQNSESPAAESGQTAEVETTTVTETTETTPTAVEEGSEPSMVSSTEPTAVEETGAAVEETATEEATNDTDESNPAEETSTPVVKTIAASSDDSTTTGGEQSEQASEPTVATEEPAAEGSEPAVDTANSGGAENSVDAGTTQPSGEKPKSGKSGKAPKKQKKISPRQRRRRWLVGVLKPLEGKRLACDKLSSFQIVMLGRALRSQVAQCSFEYDATKLVAELQRVAIGLNRNLEEKLQQIVLEYEANIREAAETAWWDDLHERASTRLVGITADHLSRQVNRGAVEAKVVMAIDAVGPRTAATAIVSADGRMLHSEDLPCQLSAAQRTQAVTKMGELIHAHHVDLLVISNGPSRRATMIALGDLIGQSPTKSIRWTLADRSGADAYASSSIANDEMRSTPRRFRAAAWLAFSVLEPAQALAKVDPLKLRLSSFQRELSDDAISGALQDVMTSGASRGGVDVNSAPTSWLQKLPGVTDEMAKAIDATRREKLFDSRQSLLDMDEWESSVHSRQAIPFLRVFGADEVLDGTLIHPEDYALAKKLASALEVELPPTIPPGYEPPDYSQPAEPADPSKLVEVSAAAEPAPVEDFSSAGESASEFVVETTESTDGDSTDTESSESQPAEGDSASGDVAVEASSDEAPAEEVPAEDSNPADSNEATSTDATSEPTADAPEQSSGDEADTPDQNAVSEATSSSDGDAPADATSEVVVHERILRPRPDRAKIDKCVKEWQIGGRRAQQLVQWLCDPFGDSDSSGNAPAVMDSMPALTSLKPGEQAIGVVVGVMPFGVFVELAPDCSGLIHVSRISDTYVEDLHEAVQVGDVVTAWVSGIDEKRRRVALSALSPEREAELEEARRSRPPKGRAGGGQRGRGPGGQRGGGQRGGGRPESGNRGGGQQSRGGRGGAAPARSGQSQGNGQSRGGAARGGGQDRGGRGRDGRGGRGRDGGRGGKKRDKKPESYRVVSKKEVKPISDAMQKGEEPLRSFGDLMQFFDQSKPDPKADKPKQVSDAQVSDSQEPGAPQESVASSDVSSSESSASSIAETPQDSGTPQSSETQSSDAPAVQDSAPATTSGETSPEPPKQDETPSADASN